MLNLCDQVSSLVHDHLPGSEAPQRASVQPEDRLWDDRQDHRLRHRSVLLQHGREELRGNARSSSLFTLILLLSFYYDLAQGCNKDRVENTRPVFIHTCKYTAQMRQNPAAGGHLAVTRPFLKPGHSNQHQKWPGHAPSEKSPAHTKTDTNGWKAFVTLYRSMLIVLCIQLLYIDYCVTQVSELQRSPGVTWSTTSRPMCSHSACCSTTSWPAASASLTAWSSPVSSMKSQCRENCQVKEHRWKLD